MKNYTIRTLVLSFLLPVAIGGMSAKTVYFVDNGVRYAWNNTTTTVEVTSPGSGNTYVGDVEIPQSVVYQEKELTVAGIRSSAFSDCTYLTSVTLPSTVTSIGDYAFDSCEGLKEVVMPGVETIGHWSFRNCYALERLEFSGVLKSIGNYCFDKILKIEKITLPATLTNIGGYAFEGNPQLKTVTSLATTPPAVKKGYLDGDEIYTIFDDTDYGDRVLYVPEGCVQAYKTALGWHHFQDNIMEISASDIDSVMAGDDGGFDVVVLGSGCVSLSTGCDVAVTVVDINGRILKAIEAKAGVNVVDGLPEGILFFNGKKVLVRN